MTFRMLLLAVVTLTASSCGASNKPTKELLRSAVPITSDVYVQIKGPAGAVNEIANAIETGSFLKIKTGPVPRYGDGGSFVPPRLHRQRVCLFAHTVQPADSPQLQSWLGKKITITVYGNTRIATLYCGLIGGVFLGTH